MTITIPLKGGSLSKTYRLPQYNTVRKEVSRTDNREYGFMRWYSQLNKQKEYHRLYPDLFPKVLNTGADEKTAWFDLEFLEDYKDIKSILSNVPQSDERLFRMSQAVWKGLDTIHSIKLDGIPNTPTLYFEEEVRQKIFDALKIPAFREFFEHGTYAYNGEIVTGIAGYLYVLENYFKELDNIEECNIHGNPTLENIMYSMKDDRVMFIDTYEESMWNTKYLDYSQVLQCSRSHYGYINDRDVRVNGNDVFNPNKITENFEGFNKHFISNLPDDKQQLIDILEATQFIRMLPFKLLAGDLNKAKYFYVHACYLLRKALR
jgi:hypothetical protein